VRVRLSRQEGVNALEVGGTEAGALRFEREGDLVRCTTSGERAARFELRPAPDAPGLSVSGRLHAARLVVLPGEPDGLRVEALVDLEQYVAGVVPSELILWSAVETEIEAQAIAARSYALRSLEVRAASGAEPFLWDDTRDQVYLGRPSPGESAAERRVHARLLRGLEASRGVVLLADDGSAYDVRFHASCGGTTCSPASAFPRESRLDHRPVPCEPCFRIGAEERTWSADDRRRRRVHWRWTADEDLLGELARRLGVGRRVRGLRGVLADADGRWQSVEVLGDAGSERVSIERLRAELDPAALKSGRLLRVWPAVGDPVEGGIFFEGLGRGHGAGLCQVGSHEYALRGWTAREILGHYLPGARLARLPDSPTRP
jgi:stage II sporulation protein D